MSVDVIANLERDLAEAETKAIDALSRYKFQMFGYWHGGFGSHVINVGKKNAGRLLDGRTWDEMPNDKSLPAHAL